MARSGSSPEKLPGETFVELGRLGNLSDGIFAVAITLLVLDIRLPDTVTSANLAAGLIGVAPRLLVYLISFIVIGGAWGSHQRMVGQIKRGDGLLVWFNLLLLLFITLIPVCSGLLGRLPGDPIALVIFTLDVILVQLSALWLWRHASKHGLLNPALDSRVVESIGRRYSLIVAGFGLSLLFVLLNSNLVYVVWSGLFIFMFATDWLSWQQSLQTREENVPLKGASKARITIGHGSGNLSLHSGVTQKGLLQGTFGGGLESHIEREGGTLTIELNALQRRGFMSWRYPWAWGSANVRDWDIALNPQTPLALTVNINAGEATLDLTDMRHITSINFITNASLITLHLPAHAGQTSMSMTGSLTSYFIHVPQGIGVEIHATKAISGLQFDPDQFEMLKKDTHYRSVDYDAAANRVDIQSEISLGSIQIL